MEVSLFGKRNLTFFFSSLTSILNKRNAITAIMQEKETKNDAMLYNHRNTPNKVE